MSDLLILSIPAVLLRLDGRVEAKEVECHDAKAAKGTCATIASRRHTPTPANFNFGDIGAGAAQEGNSWGPQAVFPGNSTEAICPHCRRGVSHYSYAFFATFKNVSILQDRVAALQSEVGRSKKHLALTKAEAEQATSRLRGWSRWATAAKGSLQAMPPSSMPHVHVSVPPQGDSETARSRSPRRPQVQLARLEFAPEVRVPEYDG